MFLKAVDIVDSSAMELLAIKEAFMLYASLKWANTHWLMLESNLKNAIGQMLKPNTTPWTLRNCMMHIEACEQKIECWEIQKIPCKANDQGDQLAKIWVQRLSPMMMVLGQDDAQPNLLCLGFFL